MQSSERSIINGDKAIKEKIIELQKANKEVHAHFEYRLKLLFITKEIYPKKVNQRHDTHLLRLHCCAENDPTDPAKQLSFEEKYHNGGKL